MDHVRRQASVAFASIESKISAVLYDARHMSTTSNSPHSNSPHSYAATCSLRPPLLSSRADCSLCISGYAPTLVYNCSKCPGGDIATIVAILVVTFALFVSAVFVAYMVSGEQETTHWRIVHRLSERLPLQTIKIVIVTWQIIAEVRSLLVHCFRCATMSHVRTMNT